MIDCGWPDSSIDRGGSDIRRDVTAIVTLYDAFMSDDSSQMMRSRKV